MKYYFYYHLKFLFKKIMYSLTAIPVYIYEGLKYHKEVNFNDSFTYKSLKQDKQTQFQDVNSYNHAPVKYKLNILTYFFSTELAFLPDVIVYAKSLKEYSFGYMYPEFFEEIVVKGFNGANISCLLGRQKTSDVLPTLILVPGLFVTKYQHSMLSLALRVFFKWKINVIIVDLREFGRTFSLSELPISCSIYEGLDIISVAEWAKSSIPTNNIYLTGFSYGASSVLSALSKDTGYISKAVIFSPFSNLSSMLQKLTRKISSFDRDLFIRLYYNWLFVKLCKLRGMKSNFSFENYIRERILKYYSFSEKELYYLASPINYIGDINTPTLIIHPQDDPVIPFQHSLSIARESHKLSKNNMYFLFPERGGHYANWLVSPQSTEEILKDFLNFV